ncbi:SDR family oxidoreductase [Kitasatospora sp. NBC_01287]|uniref:SDR family oxidoreductase n=1 Tax=Kitasatospora sp. NBC_01287 TaxID=2903573 RepID=UPI0022556812|nr:SDR family oxidoreductase [Kitasatospora sp. NBC_01287]MCX4746056.1 SDR family oxidoreductase [Kitasatospora sp. NBC_01287]
MSAENRRVSLITGADRGIGLALAHRLADAGHALILHSNEGEGLAKAVAEAGWTEDQVITASHDVADVEAVDAAVAAAVARFGKIDDLLNVAGVAYFGGVLTTDLEIWERTLRTNLTGYFLMSRAVLPHMKDAGTGTIVNMSSIWGKRGAPAGAMFAYAVSKFGIEGLTKCLIEEARPWGVKVSSIVLDKVDTGFRDNMLPHIDYTPEQRARMLSADDVVDATMAILNSSGRAHPSTIELDAWLWA